MKIVSFFCACLILSSANLLISQESTNKAYEEYKLELKRKQTLNQQEIDKLIPEAEQIEGRTFKFDHVMSVNKHFKRVLVDFISKEPSQSTGSLMIFYKSSWEYISHLTFSARFGDCSFGGNVNPIIQNSHEVITVKTITENDCGKRQGDGKTFFVVNEYKIEKDGTASIIHEVTVTETRKFPGISTRFLYDLDLDLMTSDEIDYMRNELFATYGYIFKSEKWSKTFVDKPWYQPKVEEVPLEWLSTIERRNVETILKYSSTSK